MNKVDDIIRALRCISSVGMPHTCEGCTYRVLEEVKEGICVPHDVEIGGVKYWESCDFNRIAMDAANALEKAIIRDAAEFARYRLSIKDSIIHYLCDDWNNHKRGKAHKENVAIFDKEYGSPVWCSTNLSMVMGKVVPAIWSVDIEDIRRKNDEQQKIR